MSYVKRNLDDLVNQHESAWPTVHSWVEAASRPVEALPPSDIAGDELVAMQVTTRSALGSVIYHSGGLLVDHGWLRILGSGHPRLPRSFADWNSKCGMTPSDSPPPCVLVADDALGGFFALNGGRFGSGGHTVWYFAPDTLEWEDTKLGYSEFLRWSFSTALDKFYASFRWSSWLDDVAGVPADRVFFFVPPLFATGQDLGERFRSTVPIEEAFHLHLGTI